MKKLFLFIFFLVFFSFLVFLLGNYFFGGQENINNSHIEKNYIDKSFLEEKINNQNFQSFDSAKHEYGEVETSLKNLENVTFFYIPDSFQDDISAYTNLLKIFLSSGCINEKTNNLKIYLNEEQSDVRGKMKDYTIKIFGVKNIELNEFLAVSIHEFGHFVDLYFLKKQVFKDLSDYFYVISWDGVKIMKSGSTQKDFVSGYAATNKYEDFAESFVYYILHNGDFLIKSQDSKILKQKYDFFAKYLFRNKEYQGTNFSTDNEIKSYYRDITKIKFSLENFLVFMKK